jgi:hypothetical protein
LVRQISAALSLGDGEFKFPVVGTSDHQEELETVCGGHHRSAQIYCAALLAPQFNVDDTYAVAVIIRDIKVGFLHREDAPEFRRALRRHGFADATCEAMIVSGWDWGEDDQGYFGARLNACLPFDIRRAHEWRRFRSPLQDQQHTLQYPKSLC